MCSRCRFGQQRKWYVLHIAITCSLYDGPLRYKIVKTKITQQPLYCSLFIPLRPFFCLIAYVAPLFPSLHFSTDSHSDDNVRSVDSTIFWSANAQKLFFQLYPDCGLYCLKFYVHRMPSALLFGFHRYNIITQMDFHGHFTWHLWRFLDTLIHSHLLSHSHITTQTHTYKTPTIFLRSTEKKIIASEHSYIQIGRYKNLNNCHNDLHWTFRIKNCASFAEIHRMTESSDSTPHPRNVPSAIKHSRTHA